MSHFSVLVIGENVDEQLSPFDENLEKHFIPDDDGSITLDDGQRGYIANKDAKWDWYTLGGRWTGMLKLKPNCQGNVGSPGLQTPIAINGYCDQARKKDIDFEGMMNDHIARNLKQYFKIKEIVAGRDLPVVPLRDDPAEVRTSFLENTVLKDLYTAGVASVFDIVDVLDDLKLPLCEYIDQLKRDYFPAFAILQNGEWYEKGEMGWWGVVTNEQSTGDWKTFVNEVIESLDDNELISIIDCHI